MNGAEYLIKTAVKAGVEVCFTNPGTTEIPLVLACKSESGIKAVLGLFEGVCTGAADGYGRMLDKPALTLLHLGPGLANGIANLHNARRGKSPILNLIGEHATWHIPADSPLTMDIESLAGTVSGWYKTNESPMELSQDIAEAIAATGYGQISTLIVPNDYQWADCTGGEIAAPQFSFDNVDTDSIEKAVQLLNIHEKTALIIGGRALRERGLEHALRIKATTGCDLITDHLPPYMERGVGLPDVARMPYYPEAAIELLSRYEAIIIAGTKEPVSFFGYSGFNSFLLNDNQKRIVISNERQDVVAALEYLAEALNAPPASKISDSVLSKSSRPQVPEGELNPKNICLTIAALQPENAIVVDEGITTSGAYFSLSAGLPRHSYLTTAGGSIGYGLPCAVGAAVACPKRPVINIQADGSAMYTIQALWTAARESLNVTSLICSNKSYNILKMELSRAGITSIEPEVSSLIDLDSPDIDWVKIAEGMGVPAIAVDSVEGLDREFQKALSEPGPHLIEMTVFVNR